MSFNKWDYRFMQMAHVIAGWTSCFAPGRAIGAVIVKDKRIMTTGYNGAPQGMKTCREKGVCLRRQLGIPSGTRAEVCYAIHAEQNAIIQAAKLGVRRVVYEQGYPDSFTLEIFGETGVQLEQMESKEDA